MTPLRGLLWAFLPVFLLVDGGEVAARLHPPPDPRPPPAAGDRNAVAQILLRGDPWLLWELLPGDHSEAGVDVHINAAGFRDKARGPKSRPRALSIGDSSIYGFGVPDDAVFTSVLETRFNAEFINGGVPGYSTYQSLNLLDIRGMALDPDLLIVGSLWSDDNFDSFVDKDLLSTYAGWQASPQSRLRAVLAHSVLFRWFDYTLRVVPRSETARKVGWALPSNPAPTGARRVAINDYAANLDAFCDRMEARGGGVVFLMLPNREDVAPVQAAQGWAIYRQVMQETAARRHVPLVDGPAAYTASGHSAAELFLDQMHPTVLGQKVLADAVDATLTGAGWPQHPLTVSPAASPLPTYSDPLDGSAGRPVPRSTWPTP